MANIIFKLFTTIIFLPIFANKIDLLLTNILSYIKFLLKSTNEHNVHSPFIYDFITQCLYKNDLIHESEMNILIAYKSSLINSKETILIKEFGAGSKYFKDNKRHVSTMANRVGISKKRSHLLFKITQYIEAITILEIGTSLGLATSSMSTANPKAKITTLEGCSETARIAKQQFEKFNFSNIVLKIGDFKNTLGAVINNKKYDLIYFDGNHQKQATINYFEQCLPTVKNETVFIFDDIHWSKGMEEAWDYIQNHKKVTVSIDTYQWGIIFFRKEQSKEHFIIRV